MTQDEQEALSHQHHGWWVVLLDSKRIAVFSHPNGSLVAIVDNWEQVVDLPRPAVYNVHGAWSGPRMVPEIDVGDLDL